MSNTLEQFQTVERGLFRQAKRLYTVAIRNPIQNTLNVTTGSGVGAFTFISYFAVGSLTATAFLFENIPSSIGNNAAVLTSSATALGILASYIGTNIIAPAATVGASMFKLSRIARDEGMDSKEIWNHIRDVSKAVMVSRLRHKAVAAFEAITFLSSFLRTKEASAPVILPFHGPTTLTFQWEVSDALVHVQQPLREFVASQGLKVAAGLSPLHILPDRIHFQTNEQDDPRTEISHTPGECSSFDGMAWVSEFFLDHGSSQKQMPHPSVDGIIGGNWKVGENPAATLRHEFYHNLDQAFEFVSSCRVSDTPGFINAYRNDLARLGGYDVAREKGYVYFVRPNEAKGRHEVWAELGAESNGGSHSGTQMALNWPDCFLYIQKFNDDFITSYQGGPASFHRFVNQMVDPEKMFEAGTPVSQQSKIKNQRIARSWLSELRQNCEYGPTDFESWVNTIDPKLIHTHLEDIIEGLPLSKHDRPNESAILKTVIPLPIVQTALANREVTQIPLLQTALETGNANAAALLAQNVSYLEDSAYPDFPLRSTIHGAKKVDWTLINVIQKAAVELWDAMQKDNVNLKKLVAFETVIRASGIENRKIGLNDREGFTDIPDLTFSELLRGHHHLPQPAVSNLHSSISLPHRHLQIN